MSQEFETIELQPCSTHYIGDSPTVTIASSSRTENPLEPITIVESSIEPSDGNQPVEENVLIPGPSIRVEEIPGPSGQSDNSPGRSNRMKILKQNVLKQLRWVLNREEPEVPSVPEEIELEIVPENDALSDISPAHPPTHNEEIINLGNEPPIEENRYNRRNLTQRITDQMRHCLSFIQNNFKQIIIILATLVGLTLGINLLVKVIVSTQHNVIPDIVTLSPITPPPISTQEYEKYRLPRSVKPIHYNLKILPILSYEALEYTFEGEVLIHLEILETCHNITLHLHHLTIESIWLGHNETNLEHMFSYDILTDQQFLIIYPDKTITELERLLLKIKFNGYLNRKPFGLYRSTYNYNDEVKSAAMTQMEPVYARKVFPCFDEPALQATFQITIGHKAHMTALSNMPGNLSSKIYFDAENDYVFTEFQKTPVISTYLLAFAVVDYKAVKKYDIEIYSERSQNETKMLELAQKCDKMFKFFNKLFAYKYKHPKTTFLTSNNLHYWGMEHWGLITLRTDVTYRDKDDSTIYQQEIKNVLIAHEIAHQWFGNLITPEWWSHLWLKEGYSTYMSYVAIDKLYPEDDTFIEFNKLKQETLRKDSMENTRAISKEVYVSEDLVNNVHFAVYQKAASFIMMLENVLTTEKHLSGLRSLLRERSYRTINPDDLLRNLAFKSNTDLTFLQNFINSWIYQIGFPLVTVSRDPYNVISVRQEKFYFTKSLNATADLDDPLWYIPLTYVIKGDKPQEKNEVFWMNYTRSVKLHNLQTRLEKNDWIIFNSDQIGFYRVNYEHNEWRKIISYLREEDGYHNVAPINRALLIDDSLALARADYIDYTIPFELLRYLEYENDYLPWTRVISSLKYVDIMLMKLNEYHKFKTFMQILVRNIFTNISTIEPKSSRDVKIQTEIYEWACRVDLAECIYQSKSYMSLWMKADSQVTTNPIPINLRSSIYCSAVRHSVEDVWYFLWNEFQHENSAFEQNNILHGLSCSGSELIIRDHLTNAFDDEVIHPKHIYKILHDVSQHVLGFDTIMDFYRNNMEAILSRIGKIEDLLTHSQIISKCNTEYDLTLIKEMTSRYHIRIADLTSLMNEININILWLRNNHRNILNWLDENIIQENL